MKFLTQFLIASLAVAVLAGCEAEQEPADQTPEQTQENDMSGMNNESGDMSGMNDDTDEMPGTGTDTEATTPDVTGDSEEPAAQ